MQAQADIELAKILEEAEGKRRADNIQFQMAKIEADKELSLIELELQVKAEVNTDATSFVDEKDELDSYLLCFERYAENAKIGESYVGYQVECNTEPLQMNVQ